MQRLLQYFKLSPTEEEEQLLRSGSDQPDFCMDRIYIKLSKKGKPLLIYWHHSKRDNEIVRTFDEIAMSPEDYQNDHKYLSQRSFVMPDHLFIYISEVSENFWLPFVDWPRLYPNQRPTWTDKGELREDFGTAGDMVFLRLQLARAYGLGKDAERAALQDLEALREGINDSQVRRRQYNVALNTFNCKS